MAEEDKGYEVIDKRKVKPGEDPSAQAETEAGEVREGEARAQAEEAKAEEPKREEAKEEFEAKLPPVDVHLLLRSFIGLLGSHAWQWMGLVVSPATGKVEKDLVQAKVAIDSISALAKQLEGKLDPKEQEELRGMLSDLQINYVRQSGE